MAKVSAAIVDDEDEILDLIESIQRKAKSERGVELETEVKILGEDEPQF